MTALWTSQDAAKATGGRVTVAWEANGVSIDTRTLAKGDLFVALKDVRDGHDFVAQALEKGAAAALVSHVPEGVAPDAPLLIVPDVLQALEALGAFARARTRAKAVGVTGSVGKTSTKEMLRAILSGQGATHAAEASYNNHWGVPLTLARMPVETRFRGDRDRHEPSRERLPRSRGLADLDVAMVTISHSGASGGVRQHRGHRATRRPRSSTGLKPGRGTAVMNADIATAGDFA